MVLLGVLLVLLAAAAGVLLFAGTAQLTDTVDVEILGGTLSLPPLTLLVTGMVVISLFWLGWAILRSGLRRGKRRRVQAKEAAAAAEAQRVEDERRLKEEVAARDRQLMEERRLREEETAQLRQEADARGTEPVAPGTRDLADDHRAEAPASRPPAGETPRSRAEGTDPTV
ncbi:hypothetical protein GCM10023168_29270 [Fodinibacter luteus]|uniref:DUF1049 domain-containing protein n=1 Tax=Fodinibacter luteus TaxID=552064 RepID=A0ABP8KLH6_9MICO